VPVNNNDDKSSGGNSMSKLSEWMAEAAENRLFTATVTAVALTGAIYINSNAVSPNIQGDNYPLSYSHFEDGALIEGELVTLNEYYWHLSDLLEDGDVKGAIELATSMKQQIEVVKDNFNIVAPYTVDSSKLRASETDKLNVLQNIYNNLEIALKTDDIGLFSDVVAQINEVTQYGGDEEYSASYIQASRL
jgi:hypothetical protein